MWNTLFHKIVHCYFPLIRKLFVIVLWISSIYSRFWNSFFYSPCISPMNNWGGKIVGIWQLVTSLCKTVDTDRIKKILVMSQKSSSRKAPTTCHNKWQIDFTGRSSRSLGAAAIGDKHVTPWTQVGAIGWQLICFTICLCMHNPTDIFYYFPVGPCCTTWLQHRQARHRRHIQGTRWQIGREKGLGRRFSTSQTGSMGILAFLFRFTMVFLSPIIWLYSSQVPMNMFIMWMSGNSISIFPIMMVGMMFLRPIQALFSAGQAFKAIEGEQAILQKMVWFLGQYLGYVLVDFWRYSSLYTCKFEQTKQFSKHFRRSF